MIDLVLAGDNAIVVGALAAGLPPDQRRKVIMIGVLAALVLRIAFALACHATPSDRWTDPRWRILLLWVAWKMWRELRHEGECGGSEEILGDEHSGLRPAKSFASAAWAVARRGRQHEPRQRARRRRRRPGSPGYLIVGLVFAVILMGVAANVIARYIERFRWIGYVGLLVILYVAVKMIYDGWVHPDVGLGKLFA